MKRAIYEISTGRVSRIVTCPEECMAASCAPGEASLPATFETDSTHYVVDGTLVPFPARPSLAWHWDWATKQWLLPQVLG